LKPKLIALNLLLVAALGAIVWEGRVRWQEARTERQTSLDAVAKPARIAVLAPAPLPAAAQPIQYADVATQNLFAKDRNPNVIIDPPKVEIAKPMPALPVVYGVLGLPSGTKAIMSAKQGGAGKSVRAGDQVGEFKIVSLDPQNVVFDWEGKQISRKIDDLLDRTAAPVAASGPAVAAAVPPPQVAAGPAKTEDPKQTDKPCVPGDNSPQGTVVDGYKKTGAVTPFGLMGCHWVAVQ
jgi:hypothetical protein